MGLNCHRDLGADTLHDLLADQGFLAASLNRLTGIQNQEFLRMTLHGGKVNKKFLDICRRVEQGGAVGPMKFRYTNSAVLRRDEYRVIIRMNVKTQSQIFPIIW
ncbi:hypothetical protein LZ24_03195 [Desulfobotulus alkaliphilus]|uniref:Uncharacterized protein n=1 Tax=Desulfobotulus alkaliphilus TaxID=622671 RepID=A0A562R523_9BACT|nr:hypothetical protein LZ24_03195 [Desulfobotulus alkaliphilus]